MTSAEAISFVGPSAATTAAPGPRERSGHQRRPSTERGPSHRDEPVGVALSSWTPAGGGRIHAADSASPVREGNADLDPLAGRLIRRVQRCPRSTPGATGEGCGGRALGDEHAALGAVRRRCSKRASGRLRSRRARCGHSASDVARREQDFDVGAEQFGALRPGAGCLVERLRLAASPPLPGPGQPQKRRPGSGRRPQRLAWRYAVLRIRSRHGAVSSASW